MGGSLLIEPDAITFDSALSDFQDVAFNGSVTTIRKQSKGKGKRTDGMVGGGADGVAGGGKGAAISAVVGAAAGTASAAFTGNRDMSLSAESPIQLYIAEIDYRATEAMINFPFRHSSR